MYPVCVLQGSSRGGRWHTPKQPSPRNIDQHACTAAHASPHMGIPTCSHTLRTTHTHPHALPGWAG